MRKGFTLVELLIVIGIVATLAVAVVLVVNPAELVKQSRDSVRLSDLESINKAIGFYQTQNPNGSFGDPTKIYVSVPDPALSGDQTSNCPNMGLSLLPSGYDYRCVSSLNLRKIDQQKGWIPIDFASLQSGSPIPILPVDPINTVVNGFYYTYVTGGSWKLTALFESEKRAKQMLTDGGSDYGIYEIGTDLNLANFAKGLIGYWKMDEGTGVTTADSSGWNPPHTGDLWPLGYTYPQWASAPAGCKLGNCLIFDPEQPSGFESYVNAPLFILNPSASNFTAMAWVRLDNEDISSTYQTILAQTGAAGRPWLYRNVSDDKLCSRLISASGQCTNSTIPVGSWAHVAVTGIPNGANGQLQLYFNGAAENSYIGTIASEGFGGTRIAAHRAPTTILEEWDGPIDEVRIYNRALGSDEIRAIYNATK